MRLIDAKRIILVTSVSMLAACLPAPDGTGDPVTRLFQDGSRSLGLAATDAEMADGPVSQTTAAAMQPDGTPSLIISDLQSRRSVVPDNSSYDAVARAVMACSARIEEAELKAAHLRVQAAKYNWLPRLGPNISLTSLGDFVASLVIDQVIFDNGRKIAERDYARHDVEKAAVLLSEASNARVHDALALYLAAEEGRARIDIAERSLKDMSHFEWVMNERVKGGVSDKSDLNILRQKLGEIRSERDTAMSEVATARAEIAAMAGRPLDDLRGVPNYAVNSGGRAALPVLLSETERDLATAQARIARAQHLPGLSAKGIVSSAADATGAITGAADQTFGIGTGASLQAIEASKETATRRVVQAREDAARRLAALDQQAAGLSVQINETNALVGQAKRNLDLFQAQYKAGARQVMDVVGVYETWARQSQNSVAKTFELERLRLEKAELLGLLVDGDQI